MKVGANLALQNATEAQPLLPWGFRFYPSSKQWRKVGIRARRMPVSVARDVVCKVVGVAPQELAAWEATWAVRRDGVPTHSATELLAVDAGGAVNPQPLKGWNLRYFPSSRTWRRATASRNEVARSEVANKVGVSEEMIARWEDAAQPLVNRTAAVPGDN